MRVSPLKCHSEHLLTERQSVRDRVTPHVFGQKHFYEISCILSHHTLYTLCTAVRTVGDLDFMPKALPVQRQQLRTADPGGFKLRGECAIFRRGDPGRDFVDGPFVGRTRQRAHRITGRRRHYQKQRMRERERENLLFSLN